MSEPSDPAAELAVLVERVSGNVILPGHYPFLAETAKRRAVALRLPGLQAYVRALAHGDIPGEWSSLLPHVTIKESFLFRHPQHFAALADTILPRLAAARGRERAIRVWSAGCANGEEPTTLAIVLAECGALAGREWSVLATDVDEEALAAARAGAFGERAVSQVPAHLRSRYFTKRGELFETVPAIAQRIEYRALNLVREPLPVEPGSFDVIFLRNVLIYFRPESQRRVAAAVARALAPDGVLFLGPAETLWQVSGELEPVDLEDCFCYRLPAHPPEEAGIRGPGSGVREDANARTQKTVVRLQPLPRRSGGRLEAATPLSSHEESHPDPGPRAPDPGPTGTRERLGAAVAALADGLPDRAVELLDQALLADPADAAAHGLEGFIHDLSGRTQMAVPSYRAALFLDPALFQVRLLLADALRRLGNSARAALEYREVMATLAAGASRPADALARLQLPDAAQARERCREALVGRSG